MKAFPAIRKKTGQDRFARHFCHEVEAKDQQHMFCLTAVYARMQLIWRHRAWAACPAGCGAEGGGVGDLGKSTFFPYKKALDLRRKLQGVQPQFLPIPRCNVRSSQHACGHRTAQLLDGMWVVLLGTQRWSRNAFMNFLLLSVYAQLFSASVCSWR